MAQVMKAADYIIKAANADGISDMTNMKLNKILYYAQAISLQKYGKPLFDDKIQAWTWGPVVPRVYYAYNDDGELGKKVIKEPLESVSEDAFTPEEADALSDAYVAFGKTHNAAELSQRTHTKGGPWDQVYDGGKVPGREITIAKISEYYRKHPVVHVEPPDSEGSEVIRADSDGKLVIPEDWD